MNELTRHVPVPAGINRGVANARQTTMLGLLGNPRPGYDAECRPVTDTRLRAMIETRDLGPFSATGLRPALDSLQAVMRDIRRDQREVHDQLSTAGMLCARLVRGSATAISNHSWGTAIDLKIAGRLDPRADGVVQRGLTLIAPIFNRHGWFWGAGFGTEDGMHFECGDAMVRGWHARGLLDGAPQMPPPEVLSLGDRGDDVRVIQRLLNRIGAGLIEDGDFGPSTRAAVVAFQAAHGLSPDGVAGTITVAALSEAARQPVAA